VSGGTGDPASIVGNPSNFLSVNAATPTSRRAGVPEGLRAQRLPGPRVPEDRRRAPITGLQATLAATSTPDRPWLLYIYNLVQTAPNFQLSWDQDLPSAGRPAADQRGQVLPAADHPRQFGQNMSKVS